MIKLKSLRHGEYNQLSRRALHIIAVPLKEGIKGNLTTEKKVGDVIIEARD